jgi:hypothetical protein
LVITAVRSFGIFAISSRILRGINEAEMRSACCELMRAVNRAFHSSPSICGVGDTQKVETMKLDADSSDDPDQSSTRLNLN